MLLASVPSHVELTTHVWLAIDIDLYKASVSKQNMVFCIFRSNDGLSRAIFIIMLLSCDGLFKQIDWVHHGQWNQYCLSSVHHNKYVDLQVDIN